MKASGGVAGIGPAANMISNTQGALVFDSSTNTLKLCDGNNWMEITNGGSGGSIPTGAVMAFDLVACPAGWTEYTAARGRFLRGIDNGAGNDPDGTRAPGNTQADELKSHSHVMPSVVYVTGSGPTNQISTADSNTKYDNPSTGSTGGAETRPKNVAVLFCRKT